MTIRSADQFDAIRFRRLEIALERRKADAGEGCKCTAASDDGGPFIDASKCDLHEAPKPVAVPTALVVAQRPPAQDWGGVAETIKRLMAEDRARITGGLNIIGQSETLRDRLAELGLIAGERGA